MALSGSSDALLDGVRLSDLADELPLGRSSLFELLKGLRITTSKGPGADGKGRVAWVNISQAELLRNAARAVHAGERKIADFSSAIAKTSSSAPRSPSTDSADPAPFLARLQAAERAIASGLGLTTAETSWILGVSPGSSPLVRGGIKAERTGKNCWRLSKIILTLLAFVSLSACSSPEAKKPSVLDYDPKELGTIALDRTVKLMEIANKASNRELSCRNGLQAIKWSEVALIESENLRDALKILASKDDAFRSHLAANQTLFEEIVDFHKSILDVYGDCKQSL
jgi:hypothetical protein